LGLGLGLGLGLARHREGGGSAECFRRGVTLPLTLTPTLRVTLTQP
jgi:hypothetical protein